MAYKSWPKKANKFGARRTSTLFNGEVIEFASGLEASVAAMIENLRLLGEASELRCQHAVHLAFGVNWKVDFSYLSKSLKETVWVEAKGVCDRGFMIKLRMWKNGAGPGRLEIWKGTWKRPICTEVVYPKAQQTNTAEPSAALTVSNVKTDVEEVENGS